VRGRSVGGVATDDGGATQILSRLALRLPEARAAVRELGIVIIVPEPDPDPKAAGSTGSKAISDSAQVWQDIWRALSADPSLTCGLSERLDRPELAPVGYGQAEQAVDLGIRLGRSGQLIDYHDLGIYRLLLQIGDMAQLWRFADEVLGPLVSYDAVHGGDLVNTLAVYLRNQSSPKQTARTLRVHPNTVAYRAQRIEAITGLDLTDPDDRLLAQVAVTIVESQMGQDSAP